jgi:hypothetical protein
MVIIRKKSTKIRTLLIEQELVFVSMEISFLTIDKHKNQFNMYKLN